MTYWCYGPSSASFSLCRGRGILKTACSAGSLGRLQGLQHLRSSAGVMRCTAPAAIQLQSRAISSLHMQPVTATQQAAVDLFDMAIMDVRAVMQGLFDSEVRCLVLSVLSFITALGRALSPPALNPAVPQARRQPSGTLEPSHSQGPRLLSSLLREGLPLSSLHRSGQV